MTYSGLYSATGNTDRAKEPFGEPSRVPPTMICCRRIEGKQAESSKRMLDTCRGLAGNMITFRGESIERNARRGNRPIDFMSARENQGAASRGRRNRVSLPLPIADNANEFAHAARSRQWRKETLNTRSRLRKFPARIPTKRTFCFRPWKLLLRERRRDRLARIGVGSSWKLRLIHKEAFSIIWTSTRTFGKRFGILSFVCTREETFTLSIKRDLLPTWHRVSLKNGNSGANIRIIKN